MSLGLWLCASREGGTGGGGWVSALSMAASGLGLENLLRRHETFIRLPAMSLRLSSDFRQCPWDFGSAPAERAGQGAVGGFQH